MTDMSASTMAMSTVQTLDFGGVQLIRRDVADSIEAIEDNEPATDRVRRGTSYCDTYLDLVVSELVCLVPKFQSYGPGRFYGSNYEWNSRFRTFDRCLSDDLRSRTFCGNQQRISSRSTKSQ